MSGREWGQQEYPEEHEEYEEYEEKIEEEPEALHEWVENFPEPEWARDLLAIENDLLREQNLVRAEKLLGAKEQLEQKVESGEISQAKFEMEYENGLRRPLSRARTSASLAAAGLTYDRLGDVSEDLELLASDASADESRLLNLKDEVKETVERLGPEAAQELADRMQAEGNLGKEAHGLISRQTRIKLHSEDE